MTSTQAGQPMVVHRLATLLRNNGDSVLDGSSTLTLKVGCLQHLTQLFERHLLSRTHQHGFLALPSHPADTASLLEVQLLFDMLQKTVSLKLVNPPGVKLQYAVKIFPFKSLKYLELKRIPPHCLEGLRGVYSQLEVFTCSKGVSSLEELLSLCGGDLSSALPWLELHTLNFSYNSISRLDESLSLLNVLKWLDLSHNKIQDCAEFLKPLTELEHLNLSYNNLQRAPALGLSAQAKLTTLILRNNELETINGVEQLSSLQCLDLAYNLLMEHSQLAPLSLLHNLNTLTLEGNPLYFLKTHRASTVCHLSQASFKLQLDGTPLSQSDLLNLAKSGQLTGQISHTSQNVYVAPDQGGQEVSSGGGDITDSVTISISGEHTQVRKKKRKSKVKVRRASISEPSDTDHEIRVQSALQDIVLTHKKDIERMDSFREQLGEDWLRYQHHLDDTPVNPAFPGVESVTIKVNTNGCSTPPSPLLNTPPTSLELLPPPLLSSELKEEGDKEETDSTDLQPETESTLQWTGQSLLNTESTLETSLVNIQAPTEAYSDPQPPPEEDDDDKGVDLCRPMLVGLLSEDVEMNRKRASEPLFLRVWQGHLLEVDMHQGCVKTRVELDSLRDVVITEATCTVEKVETTHPALELHFRYISRERRKRCYIMLDDKPQEALEVLAEVLSRVVEENKQQVDEERPETVWLQCLKCQAEFCQPATESDNSLSHLDELKNDSCTVICSECKSDHVVQLAIQLAPSTSTPLEQNDARYFTFDDRDNPVLPLRNKALVPGQSLLSRGSPLHLTQQSEASTEGATAYFHTAHSFLSNSQNEAWVDQRTSQLISFSTTDGQGQGSLEGFKEKVADNSCYNGYQKYQDQQSPKHTEGYSNGQFDLLSETVDHRLQLFLDVEVFGGEEELHCFLKMSIVKFGDSVEFHSLMVVSDQYIYILEITSQSDGQPSDWLRKRESHRLCELSYLEVGLGSQSIHLEFDEGAAAYTLLVRNSARCKWFFSKLTEIARELAPKSDSKLKGISTTRLNPQHHLWHLVCEDALPCDVEDSHPPFRYLLAFLQRDGSLDSVSVLATKEMLFLLDEDHQWSKSQPEGQMSSGKVTVQETQPISCLSSIYLFSSNPCQVDLKLYDEMTKKEKTWSLHAEDEGLVQDLVDWITNQWEKMFGVKLATIKQ
ncbi:serine/threonine-protein kinase 11-interacting protein [Pimephales promelas]|uniref:serine/threonine-protein kinase 11-interacting protein n=1 Tax=Pimephales promelas TaxID=90988 RepID=UPI00195589C9|nr:serine/threonine-protein kinase 11-interacting protein [Pimephales promelas]XP_039511863.1 serine/threonine-protein kinase 11-interacting protein [Pimephales promelas]KAG1960310.1 Outer arm dynein light chain 1 protein [Pimephales promelas]